MIKYLKLKKPERAHIMQKVMSSMPPSQGGEVQTAVLSVMEHMRLDYADAMAVVMEIGANWKRIEVRK